MVYDILELCDMLMTELVDIATKLSIANAIRYEKNSLIYAILDCQAMHNLQMPELIAYAEKQNVSNIFLCDKQTLIQKILETEAANIDNNLRAINSPAIGNKYNEPIITVDPFTNRKTIKWSMLSDWRDFIYTKSIDENVCLSFTFNHIDGENYLVFQILPVDFILSKGDKIYFLFDNGKVLEFILTNKSFKVRKPWGAIDWYESKVTISGDNLRAFQDNEFKQWKITFCKTNHYITSGDTASVSSAKIKKMATAFREVIKRETENFLPFFDQSLELNEEANVSQECHVYLMIDYSNNYHKIGIANNPDFREKTLQSEKPTIELIAAKKFINRKIASSFEKALHTAYSKKRIRGEWFRLDAVEINEIKITLQS